jgi:putative redox protein
MRQLKMKTDNVQLQFSNQFVGSMTSPSGRVVLGQQPDGIAPYHLLFGAVGSCFYSTFLSVANKKRLTFVDANLEISGIKRDTIPATLEYLKIIFTIRGGTNHAQLKESAELGAKYCSIHETISKVAKIDLVVEFKD